MSSFDFKSATPVTSGLTDAKFFLGAESQAATTPTIYQNVALRAYLLGSATSTLAITAAKTLTATHSLTLAGTDSTTMTFPATTATIARTDASQTFTGNQTFAGNAIFSVAASGPTLKQGANGRVGTFVATGSTPVAVANSSVAITDAIVISLNAVGGTIVGQPVIVTITAGVGFSVAAGTTDTSTYNYAILKNAA